MFPREIIAITLFGAVMAVPLSSATAQTERRTISSDRIAIYNLAGKVRVEPGRGADVVVEVTRGGRDAEQLRVEEGTIGDVETLRVLYPSDHIVYPAMDESSRTTISVRDDGTWGRDKDSRRDGGERNRVEISGSGRGMEAYADLRILVPRGQRVEIHQAVGDARLTNVDADLLVDASAADVTTQRTRGTLSLDTGSGSLSVTDAQGDVKLDTGSGSVSISGVHGESLRMDTGSGSIEGGDIEVSDLKADVGSGGVKLGRVRAARVAVDAGSGGTDLELLSNIEQLKIDAGSGGVTVRLPGSQNADVDIETGSGGIDTDFAVQVTRMEQRHMIGRIGNGQGRIRIESGSGHVRLLRG